MKTKRFFSSFLFVSCLMLPMLMTAGDASAKVRRKVTNKKTALRNAPPTAPSRSESASGPLDIQFGATVGLGINDGNFGFGAGFRADLPLTLEQISLRVGAETGIYRFSFTGGSLLVFPLVATGQYQIEGLNLPFKAYVRSAIGIDIVSASVDATTVTLPGVGQVSTASSSDTTVKFHFVVAPGAMIPNTQVFAELPIGTVAGGFLILPTVGYRF
jgi:hypothetical protein